MIEVEAKRKKKNFHSSDDTIYAQYIKNAMLTLGKACEVR